MPDNIYIVSYSTKSLKQKGKLIKPVLPIEFDDRMERQALARYDKELLAYEAEQASLKEYQCPEGLVHENDGKEWELDKDFGLKKQVAQSPDEWKNVGDYWYEKANNNIRRIVAIPIRLAAKQDTSGEDQEDSFSWLVQDIDLILDFAISDKEKLKMIEDKLRKAFVALAAPSSPSIEAEQQEGDAFIKKHLNVIWQKTKDCQIERFIRPMFDNLSAASIKYFLETGTINGDFNIALNNMMDAIRNWQPTSSPASKEGAEAYWGDVEDVFDKHTSPTGGGYEADYTDKHAFISELKSKYFLSIK